MLIIVIGTILVVQGNCDRNMLVTSGFLVVLPTFCTNLIGISFMLVL